MDYVCRVGTPSGDVVERAFSGIRNAKGMPFRGSANCGLMCMVCSCTMRSRWLVSDKDFLIQQLANYITGDR